MFAARTPHEGESESYLRTLFSPYVESNSIPEGSQLRIELRPLLPRHVLEDYVNRGERPDRPRPAFWRLDGSTYGYAAATAQMWTKQWEVYAGVFPRMGNRGRIQDIQWAHWLYADFDGIYGLPPTNGLPMPQIVVKSGGGLHGYWRLADPVDISDPQRKEEFHRLIRRFVIRAGADIAVHDIARILRVPGTVNHKYHPAREVSILCLDPQAEAKSAQWYDEHLPKLAMPRQAEYDRRRSEVGDYDSVPAWLIERITTPAPPGRWNDLTLRSAVNLRRRGLPMDMIDTMLSNYASISGKADALHRSELARILRWVERNIY